MKHARKDYDKRIQDSAGLIPGGEPVFLLRGQDKFAPDVLRYYAFLVRNSGHHHSELIVKNTLAHANTMRAWQATRKCKEPDMEKQDDVYGDNE